MPKKKKPDLYHLKENPIVMQRFIQKSRDLAQYSDVKIVGSGIHITTDYTYAKKAVATPEQLKRAMFHTSSRGIAAALAKN